MRITTQMSQATILDNINAAYRRVSDTQNELSTGQRINQPSDDPYGASLAVRLKGEIAGLTSNEADITDGIAWTQASDSALMGIGDMTQSVRQIVVQASNGTLSQSDRAALAQQVTQLTQAIKQQASTKYAGQYIFAGTATATQPYPSSTDVYQGDTGQVTRAIGPGSTLAVNADISSVLGSGGGDGKLLDTLRTIAQDLTSNNGAALGGNDLKRLDTNLDSLSQLQANVGATENRLQLAQSRIADLQTSDAGVLSNTQDADIAKLMLDFNQQQSAYTAALKSGASIIQTSLVDFLR